jgi:hypothetical protein
MTQERDVELTTVDELLDEARLPKCAHYGCDRCDSLGFVVDDARPPDADGAVFTDGLDDEREGQVASFVGPRQDATVGRGDAGRLQPLFDPVFSEPEAEHLRRRAGEWQTHELKQERYRALETGVAGERLAQVERAVGVEIHQASAKIGEVPVDGDELRVATSVSEGRSDGFGDETYLGSCGPSGVGVGTAIFVIDVVEDSDPFTNARTSWWGPPFRRRRCRGGRRFLDRHSLSSLSRTRDAQ